MHCQTEECLESSCPMETVHGRNAIWLFWCRLSKSLQFHEQSSAMQCLIKYHMQAETSDNVQQCGVDIYLRNKEAKACHIFSTIHLPLFNNALRRQPVAVLEITQFKGSNTSYQAVFDWSRMYLQVNASYLHCQPPLFLHWYLQKPVYDTAYSPTRTTQ